MAEKRIDQVDGVGYTKAEMSEYYRSSYTKREIAAYWDSCTVAKGKGKGKGGKGKGDKVAPKAKAKVKAKASKPIDYSVLQKGDKLQAQADDGKWYAAAVVAVSKDKKRAKTPVKINYVGYTAASDEWLGGDRLRGKALQTQQKPTVKGTGKILCLCGGTRGDQQPVAVTASQLKKMGYEICFCSGPEGKGWVEDFGFDEYAELASFEALVRENKGMKGAAETGDFTKFFEALAPALGEGIASETKMVKEKVAGNKDFVGMLATSTHAWMAELVQRKYGIPGIALYLSPFCPTKEFPPYIIDLKKPETWQSLPNPDGSTPGPFATLEKYPGEAVNRDLWNAMMNAMCGPFIPLIDMIADELDCKEMLPETTEGKIEMGTNMVNCVPLDRGEKGKFTTAHCTVMYAYHEILVGGKGHPLDFTERQRQNQIGYMFDRPVKSMSGFTPEMLDFLKKGDKPVYLGWGSMCREKNDELVRAAVDSCKRLGKRGIILYGWAHLSIDMLDVSKDADLLEYAKDNILFVKRVDHAKLFPKCCCLVTHGGAGTAAQMLRSGTPSIVTPVWWDQNFMGDRMEVLGTGKRGPHFSQVTGETLAELIKEVTSVDSFKKKAMKVAKVLRRQEPADTLCAMRMHELIIDRRKRKVMHSSTMNL